MSGTEDSDIEADAGDRFAGLLSSLKSSKRLQTRKSENKTRKLLQDDKQGSQRKRKKSGEDGAHARAANGGVLAAAEEAAHAERISYDSEAARDTFADHFDREAAPIERAADGAFSIAFGDDAGAADGPTWALQGVGPTTAPLQLQACSIKERLRRRWADVHGQALKPTSNGGDADALSGGMFIGAQQAQLFALLHSYRDVTMPTRPYPDRVGAPDPLMDAVLLHCLNHCNKAADAIKKGNEALKGALKGGAEALRDQGFTRPKVLILLPFRNRALAVVQRLAALAQAETRSDSVQHKERFLREFGDEDEGQQVSGAAARKPAEHQALFGGNCDDHFRLGIKLTRGAVRLYSEFLQSDVIVASPLGLTTLLTEAAAAGDAGAADFLTSIEIAVVDRADVLLMQNWMHVAEVFDNLNALPKAQQIADVMRVRPWYLDGQASAFRQTVALSSFAFPELNSLSAQRCANWGGRAVARAQHQGVLAGVVPQLRQVFERVGGGGGRAAADARFEHFCAGVWPRLQSSGATGQLLFVSSYFDYVRVRNFLQGQGADFAPVSEYAGHSEAARARSHFADGRARLLLYTERAHFYNRHRLRGVRDVVFYQLPLHAHFYAELVNAVGSDAAAAHATVTTLFAPEDAGVLERVVGSARSRKMLKHVDTPTFMFC